MRKSSSYSEFQLDSLSYSKNKNPSPRQYNGSTVSNNPTFGEVDDELDNNYIGTRRPSYHRMKRGRSLQPLLSKGDNDANEERGDIEIGSPAISRKTSNSSASSNLRSVSPDEFAELETYTKYKFAAFFLGLSLITFVVQTETAVYIQHELGWDKPYCMLYLTHGSWSLLLPLQFLILRVQQRNIPWKNFLERNLNLLRTTAQMVQTQQPIVSHTQNSPIPYLIRTTATITCALTIAGGTWYIAVNLTSPSDLTAIYNCSAFFAYAFSVPILGEKLRWDKTLSVLVAVLGVFVVAYGDSIPIKNDGKSDETVDSINLVKSEANNRLAGNIVIGVGSVLYGFYEVLYKRLACPPEGTSAGRSMIFANTFGSLIGIFTLSVLWIPIPILHFIGLEKFELPRGEAAWLLGISIMCNAVFSSSFLILISLTSPVLSSVAALLTIFLVGIVDWLFTGMPLSPAAIIGGILIITAFIVLSWSTYREMSKKSL